jgi:DNA-binding CsgD family transcriptional regulator/tetratricopeptide (TPR) repeat protein
MVEFESIITDIERDLNLERCLAALPRMLELTQANVLGRTRAYLLAARCAFIARDALTYEEMLREAKALSEHGSLEARARVTLLEASLLTASAKFTESDEKLQFALDHLGELTDEVQGLALSIQGRNELCQGDYVAAIDSSHEAIALSPSLSSAAAYAHGTIASVFQAMGRITESEHYALEQLRIMSERGSTQWLPGIYTFLSIGAADSKDYDKAHAYAKRAAELTDASGAASASPTLSLIWLTSSKLEMNQPEDAMRYAKETLESAKQENNVPMQMNAYLLLGEAQQKLGHSQSALDSLLIPLSHLDKLSDGTRLTLYRSLAETYKALNRGAEAFDICYKLWELQADFDNRTREALLRYHKALEEKVYAQKTAMLNMRTAQMERELAMSATQLVAQVDLLGRFRNDLREIVRQAKSDDPALRQVKDKLKELPCEQIDWVNFDAQFSSVHPEFKSKLQEKHPDLTRSETKICALSRMKLTSEEIGRLLCLSERTVQTHRLNIRKKLGLRTEQNLGTYLASL